MIDLTFNNGTVERFTLVLSQRDYTHLGQITNIKGMKFKANLNAADELSFEVCKELDGKEERLWEDIYDLRLVWIRELNEYFEIDVESTDTVNIIKYVTAKSLCESELSQTGLHDIEINTADDIAREDYDPMYPTVFYRPLPSDPTTEEYKKKKNSSLLHRIMDKVPAYSIGHVDETLMNQQRIFSISDTTLYDFMIGECSEQFNCLFQFDSATRTISAYDLKTTCLDDDCPYYINANHEYYSGDQHLRYRGLFNDRCPICGSNYLHSFGMDTNVFVSTENLTDEVKFDTDVASMKNCFRLEAGDDNMTAAVINSNPNGTRYIYEFNAESKKDMPEELVSLIESYDELYNEYNNQRDMELDTSLIPYFNLLCTKYDEDQTYHRGDEWKQIITPVYGYRDLIPHYYNLIDFYQYLKSSLMPVVYIPKTTVQEEMNKLVAALTDDNTVGVSTTPKVAATVASAVTNLCKLYVNTGIVKVNVETVTWDPDHFETWTGSIKLTSYEDDTDSLTTTQTLTVTLDFATYMDQKISKYIKRSKESVELYDVLKISDLDEFKNQLKLYSAKRLESFRDSLQAVLGILIEADQGHDGSEPETPKSELYDAFYYPYFQKLQAAEEELNIRNAEVALIYGTYDIDGNVQKKGVIQYIMEAIIRVQTALNFKEYIYNNTYPNSYDLYNVYTTYIREDNYSNSNYISDDLNNDQLFENAGRFLEIAKDELHKSATYQHSITTNLNNLMAIPKFEPLLDKFNLGNWIRVQEDERIYRLRLISYTIDFDNIVKLDTEFSDVTITADGMNDVMSIMKQASSMASTYSYVQQQAEVGSTVQTNYIDDWLQNGLNSALIRINNNDDEDISIDNTGILARSYDDISETHEPEQLRITHNVIAFTDDNWKTVKTSLGKFSMTHHAVNAAGINVDKNAIDRYDEYGLVANAVLAGWIVGSYIEGGNIISSHYQMPGNESYIDMSDVTTAGSGKEYFIKYKDFFRVKKDGSVYASNVNLTGKITATSGKVGNWTILPTNSSYYIGAGALYYAEQGKILGYDSDTAVLSPEGCYMKPGTGQKRFGWTSTSATDNETFIFGAGNNFGINVNGKLYASDAVLTGNVTATSGYIGSPTSGWTITSSHIYNGLDSIYGTDSATMQKTGTCINAIYGYRNQKYDATTGITKWARIAEGVLTANSVELTGGTIAGLTIEYGEKGLSYNSAIGTPPRDFYFKLTAWGGITCGTFFNNAWMRMDYVTQYGLLKVDYGNSDSSYKGIIVTKVGNNTYNDPGSEYVNILYNKITCPTKGNVEWDGSDRKLKKNIKDLTIKEAENLIFSVRARKFEFKAEDNPGERYGFIAQELREILPEKSSIEYESSNICSIHYMDFIAPICMIVKNQQTQINELQEEINRLKGENNG